MLFCVVSPALTFRPLRQRGLDRLDDENVLSLAASQGRILVSHDKRTLPREMAAFVRSGVKCPGVLLVIPQHAPIREVAETPILIWADDHPNDWIDLATKIPF
jgi:hypothetical protein